MIGLATLRLGQNVAKAATTRFGFGLLVDSIKEKQKKIKIESSVVEIESQPHLSSKLSLSFDQCVCMNYAFLLACYMQVNINCD